MYTKTMHPTLFLTREEFQLFEKLPEATRHGFHVAEETGTDYETQAELEDRFAQLSLGDTPEEQEFGNVLVKSLSKGTLDSKVVDAIPSDLLLRFLHAIGACGICALMETALHQKKVSRETITNIALLSTVRHRILLQNHVGASLFPHLTHHDTQRS